MKKQKIFLSVLLLLFFSINSLVAQALELDISKAQKIALENNIQYKLAKEALSKAKAQVTEARGGMLPSLSAFSQYQRAWELPTVIFDDPFSDGKIILETIIDHFPSKARSVIMKSSYVVSGFLVLVNLYITLFS